MVLGVDVFPFISRLFSLFRNCNQYLFLIHVFIIVLIEISLLARAVQNVFVIFQYFNTPNSIIFTFQILSKPSSFYIKILRLIDRLQIPQTHSWARVIKSWTTMPSHRVRYRATPLHFSLWSFIKFVLYTLSKKK